VAMSGMVEKMGARNMLRDQTENISMSISNLFNAAATAIADHQCVVAFAQTLWHRSGLCSRHLRKKKAAHTTAVRPVRPPSRTAAADST